MLRSFIRVSTIESLRRLALIVVAVMVVQLPLAIVQALFFATSVDQIGGTFGTVGGTAVLAVVMALVWTVAAALLLGRRPVWLLPIGLAIAAVLLISEGKAGFLFAAVGTIAVGLTRAIANPRRGTFVLVQYISMSAAAVAVLFVGYAYLRQLAARRAGAGRLLGRMAAESLISLAVSVLLRRRHGSSRSACRE